LNVIHEYFYQIKEILMSTAFAVERDSRDHKDNLYRGTPFAESVSGFENISENDIKRYHKQGFLVVKGAFSPEEASAAREELDLMCRADDPKCISIHYERHIAENLMKTGVDVDALDSENEDDLKRLRSAILDMDSTKRAHLVRKFVGFTKEHPPLKNLSHSAALKAALRQITDEKMKLFVSQALVKPPGGREKPWHQDHAYFDVPIDTPIVGVWIALDQATPENGCMHVWPAGHKEGPRIHFQIRDWQLCDTDIENAPVVSVPLDAGDLLLFDGKIPHGTPTNSSDTQRWAVQYHYIPSTVEKVDKEIRLEAFGSDGKDVFC
jgi:phytanoyl-CoA hydroxylase